MGERNKNFIIIPGLVNNIKGRGIDRSGKQIKKLRDVQDKAVSRTKDLLNIYLRRQSGD